MYDDATVQLRQQNKNAAHTLNRETREQFVNSVVLGTALAKNILGYTPRVVMVDVDYQAVVEENERPTPTPIEVPVLPTLPRETSTEEYLANLPPAVPNATGVTIQDRPPSLNDTYAFYFDRLQIISARQKWISGMIYQFFNDFLLLEGATAPGTLADEQQILANDAAAVATQEGWWEWMYANAQVAAPDPVQDREFATTGPDVDPNTGQLVQQTPSLGLLQRINGGANRQARESVNKPWLSAVALSEAALVLSAATGQGAALPPVYAPVADAVIDVNDV
jgi:hypothetical protein